MMDTSKFDAFDDKSFQAFCSPAQIERDFQILIGIISGISADEIISPIELAELENWLLTVKLHEHKKPYKELLEIIKTSIEDSILEQDEKDNIIWFCRQHIERTGYYDVLTSGIQQLTGILQGIAIDNEINEAEIKYLDNWLEANEHLKTSYPYDEVYSIVTSIYNDKILTKEEAEVLLGFTKVLCSGTSVNANVDLVETLKLGYCQVDPVITIPQKTFCITGVSKKLKRREIAEQIELFGGYVTNSINKKLDYLIVCDEKNTCWAFTCYGRKIEQVVNHRKAGLPISIVHEFDLYDSLEDLKAN